MCVNVIYVDVVDTNQDHVDLGCADFIYVNVVCVDVDVDVIYVDVVDIHLDYVDLVCVNLVYLNLLFVHLVYADLYTRTKGCGSRSI